MFSSLVGFHWFDAKLHGQCGHCVHGGFKRSWFMPSWQRDRYVCRHGSVIGIIVGMKAIALATIISHVVYWNRSTRIRYFAQFHTLIRYRLFAFTVARKW